MTKFVFENELINFSHRNQLKLLTIKEKNEFPLLTVRCHNTVRWVVGKYTHFRC